MDIRPSVIVILTSMLGLTACSGAAGRQVGSAPGVAVLLVDTDRRIGSIDRNIYGHFLEHINHSVEDGLFAEQIQGAGFEGDDFKRYWTTIGAEGSAALTDVAFGAGVKSVRVAATAPAGANGIRQDRIHLEAGREYNGSVWLNVQTGSPNVVLRVAGSDARTVATVPLETRAGGWHEAQFAFLSDRTDRNASIEIGANGSGAVLIDFPSLMRADVRAGGMLRPDLLEALRNLAPPFIRWPGGSFATTYKWKDGVGPFAFRTYHPNAAWGGYSDYYGFGTHEFMELARQLGSDALVVLPSLKTDAASVQYALDWVHYLVDPPTSEMGALRARNGHPEPFPVRYFQIDNEPMNEKMTAEQYAAAVNLYGSQIRRIAPSAIIVACGQKRSNDLQWSQTVIDLAGANFDVLGVHNYEYESDRFQTGVRRIGDYLIRLRDYVRASDHPQIRLAVLEWNLSRTYDWRAGLHAAGSLILYETLGPELTMTSPALLMRNTTDDPTWTALIYHDHVSWFPGGAYVVEKLFRQHYAEIYLTSTSGTFRDLADRSEFFSDISTMKPEAWRTGTVDAIATASADGRRLVLKAVNYDSGPNVLLVRLKGSNLPAHATVKATTIHAALTDAATIEQPNRIQPMERTIPYSRDLAIELSAYEVAVVEFAASPQ
jgi:alpha-L-arabinofuranosidase